MEYGASGVEYFHPQTTATTNSPPDTLCSVSLIYPPNPPNNMKLKYTYPRSYACKQVSAQFDILRAAFPKLPDLNLEQETSKNGEGIFAIPHWKLIGTSYTDAVFKIMAKLKESRLTYDWRNGNWSEEYLKQLPVKETFWNSQTEGIVLISVQFGQKHAGESVQTVRGALEKNELPLGIYECLIMLLTHPERLQSYDDLWIDCPGDEFAPVGGGVFACAPRLHFSDDGVGFDAKGVSDAVEFYGSASGFVPQPLETGSLESSESFSLESAIAVVKNAGYKVYKEK